MGDTYLDYNQSRTLEKWVIPFMDKISNNYALECTNTTIKGEGDDQALSDMHRNKLTLEQMLEKYPKNMGAYIEGFIGTEITPENKTQVLETIFNLIEFLKNKKFERISIRLMFYSQNVDIKKEFIRLPYNYGGFLSEYLNKDKYRFVIFTESEKEIEHLKNIRTVKDIEKNLKINKDYKGEK